MAIFKFGAKVFVFFLVFLVFGILAITLSSSSNKELGQKRGADTLIEDFESPNAESLWTFSNGPEFPGAKGSFHVVSAKGRGGSKGGELAFDFSGGGAYVAACRSFSAPLSCQGVSFWVAEYVPGSQLGIRMTDESNQTFQKLLPARNDLRAGWVRYSILTGDNDVYWGGANDGIFHGALAGVSIFVAKGINFYKTGSMVIDDIMTISSREVASDPFGVDALTVFYQGKIADLLGVNIHFITPDTRLLDLANQAGFGFVRNGLFWTTVEKVRGMYDFSEYDRLMSALQARGMGAYLILGHANPLYYDGPDGFQDKWGPQTPAARSAFAKYAAEAARHFTGKKVWLEVWNEPNIVNFWTPKPNPLHYNLLAVATLRAIKAQNEKMPVIIMATSTVDASFIDKVFSYGGLKKVDAVSIHPYRAGNPETYYQETSAIEKIVKNRTGRSDIPVYSGEWGYSATWFGGRTNAALKQQALYAIREILLNLLRKVKKTVWYDLKDDGDNPTDSEHNFGLVKNRSLQPKPAYNAIKAFHDLLPPGNCSLASFETHLSAVYGLLIKNSNGKMAAIWSDGKNIKIVIQIPDRKGMQFFNMYGKAISAGKSGSYRLLKLREQDGPIYIKIPANS